MDGHEGSHRLVGHSQCHDRYVEDLAFARLTAAQLCAEEALSFVYEEPDFTFPCIASQ